VVSIQSLSKSFGEQAVLKNLSLDIEAGERFILLGRSGCGKTTLLRLCAGFDTPDGGGIFIDGQNILPLPVERRPVGIIFQNYGLFPHMTVYDNIAVGPRIRKISETGIARQIGELLEITHLKGLQDAYPGRLSGGESQRVALARAIINRPKILLLDEPLSALDATLRQSLREELREMQKTLGITFLFVTHDQEEAMSLATRMGILEEGRLLQVGTPEELYHHPQSPFVAGFLGAVNRLPGVVLEADHEQTRVYLGTDIRIQCAPACGFQKDQFVSCFIRPEKIFLGEKKSPGTSWNCLKARIIEKTFLGQQTQYRARLINEQTLTLVDTRPVSDAPGASCHEGDTVTLSFSAHDVMLFARPRP